MKTFKYLGALCLALTLTLMGFAQEKEIVLKDVAWRGFNGVHVQPGQGAYTFYFGEKSETKGMAYFWLELFDLELNPIKKVKLEISKNSKLVSSAYNGKTFLFAFNDVLKRKSTYITMDQDGNVIEKRVREKVKMALLSEENAPKFFPIGDDEFVIIQPLKEKKVGYIIERINSKFDQKYEESYTPDKGIWTAIDAELQGDKLYVIKEKRKAATSNTYYNDLVAIDVATGKESYTHAFFDGDDTGFPTFFNVEEDGSVVSGGMYFKGEKFDPKNSDGIFFTTLDPAGKQTAYSKTSWKSIKEEIRGDFSSALVGGKTKMILQNIVKRPDGNYTIIGESFRKSNNANMSGAGALKMAAGMKTSGATSVEDVGFTIMDIVLFNFDGDAKLTGIDKVSKPERALTIKGKIASKKGLEIALFMLRAQMFCYRDVIVDGGQQYVFFVNREGVKNYAYFLPVGSTDLESAVKVDMNRGIDEKLNNLAKVGQMLGDNEVYDTGSYGELKENPNRFRGGSPFKPGYMLMYRYFNTELKIWLQPIAGS